MKYLMWLAFFGLVIAALYSKKAASKVPATPAQNKRQFDSAGAEIMLCCVHCGVYIPSSEAIHRSNQVYCCEDHCGKAASL